MRKYDVSYILSLQLCYLEAKWRHQTSCIGAARNNHVSFTKKLSYRKFKEKTYFSIFTIENVAKKYKMAISVSTFPWCERKKSLTPTSHWWIKQIITRDRKISAPKTMLNLRTNCGVNISCNIVINQKSCHGVSGSRSSTDARVPKTNQLNKLEWTKYHPE